MLSVISVAGIIAFYRITGGREIADDARMLSRMVFQPFVLWGDYGAAGFSDSWGSFPPLLPFLFGLLTRPWFELFPDFAALRIGVLTWNVVMFMILARFTGRTLGLEEKSVRLILWVFVLLPSVILAIVFIPQEEIYVAIFAIALFAAGIRGRWGMITVLLLLTALAGKYFLLVLIVPLAFASGRPKKNILLWGGLSAAVLGIYVLYHYLAFGLRPILGHVVPYNSSLSVWGLLWNIGLQLEPATVKVVSLPILLAAVLFAGAFANRKGLPLPHSFAVTLYITLALLSITFPAYILWNIPFVLICAAMTRDMRTRAIMIAGAFVWGAGEFGANFCRGVELALSTERGQGKTELALAAQRVFGEDFPWHSFHVACLVIVLVSGAVTASLIWRDGIRLSRQDHSQSRLNRATDST